MSNNRNKTMNSQMKFMLIIPAAIIAIVLLGVMTVQSAQNTAYSLEEQVQSARADITVQEKRRAELIPNLVDCVKQYDSHEYQTLMDVIASRGAGSDEAAEEIATSIQVIAEQYPELKSSENYKNLMNELTVTENLIANYRESYNDQVSGYNRHVRKFPTRWFLDILGYEYQNYERLDYGDTYEDAPTDIFGE